MTYTVQSRSGDRNRPMDGFTEFPTTTSVIRARLKRWIRMVIPMPTGDCHASQLTPQSICCLIAKSEMPDVDQ